MDHTSRPCKCSCNPQPYLGFGGVIGLVLCGNGVTRCNYSFDYGRKWFCRKKRDDPPPFIEVCEKCAPERQEPHVTP